MESLDYWRFHEDFSVVQAAILIVDQDPSNYGDNLHEWEDQNQPIGFRAVFSALQNAINAKSLPAIIRYKIRLMDGEQYPDASETVIQDGDLHYAFVNQPDWQKTTINIADLKSWLIRRGFKPDFFFVNDIEASEFLNPSHPCYAPKLAAAVTTWQKFSGDQALLGGKTPKQAMMKWLRENANQYDLTDEDGKVNETGVEEISKIANWKPEGGAAKTPGVGNQNSPTPLKTNKNPLKSPKSGSDKSPL